MSGYFASDEVWTEFEPLWHDALHTEPAIDYFHMRECFKLEKQFVAFNRHQADRKLNELLDVLLPFLRNSRIREFTSVLDWAVYDRVVSEPVKAALYNPYLFLLGAIQSEVTKYIYSVGGEPVYFFFDDQFEKLELDAARQFSRARSVLPAELSGLLDGQTFKSDTYCYPLQAADLIAWQRHRKALNLSEDLGDRKEFRRICGATRAGLLLPYNDEGLADFCRRMDVLARDYPR